MYRRHRCRIIAVVLFSLGAFVFPLPGETRDAVAGPRTERRSRVLGKTPQQIAGMGIVPWTNFYCGAKQWSTASQADAAAIFGRSLRLANDTRIARAPLSPDDRRALVAIRRLSSTYAVSLLELAARDGGTMWIPMRAGVPAAVEELVADLIPLLSGKAPAASEDRAAEIRKRIAATESGLAQADNTVKLPGYAGQAINLRKARASFAQVKKEYAASSWPGSLVLLDWYAARSGRFTPTR